MANQRMTFAKRQREQNRKDKAQAKQERLAARRAARGDQKGPPIAWDEAVRPDDATADTASDAPPPATTDDVPSDGTS